MLERRKYLDLDVGLGSVPVIVDINNDQQSELIIGSDSGKIFSFQADSEIQSSKVWKPSEEYFKELKFPVGGNPVFADVDKDCLLYTSPSPRDLSTSRMPSSA